MKAIFKLYWKYTFILGYISNALLVKGIHVYWNELSLKGGEFFFKNQMWPFFYGRVLQWIHIPYLFNSIWLRKWRCFISEIFLSLCSFDCVIAWLVTFEIFVNFNNRLYVLLPLMLSKKTTTWLLSCMWIGLLLFM